MSPLATVPETQPSHPLAPARRQRPRRGLPTGVEPLDALQPFVRGSFAFAESATPFLDRVLLGLTCEAVARGRDVVWVDGAHVLDVYDLAQRARARGLDPGIVLDGVHVARGFTAYQQQALVEERLPEVLEDPVGLVVAAGLPRLYMDDDVDPEEAATLLGRALATLRRVARERHVPVVASHRGMALLHRAPALRKLLHDEPDELLRLFPAGDGAIVRFPRRGATVHCPPPGSRQRRLDEFGGGS